MPVTGILFWLHKKEYERARMSETMSSSSTTVSPFLPIHCAMFTQLRDLQLEGSVLTAVQGSLRLVSRLLGFTQKMFTMTRFHLMLMLSKALPLKLVHIKHINRLSQLLFFFINVNIFCLSADHIFSSRIFQLKF